MDREERTYDIPEDMELRVDGDDSPTISGYAAVFNRKSLPLGFMGFREIVAPGAFKETIKTADVRALFNHDPSMVLGRTKNGTLTLEEDDKGLKVAITPPDTTWANDVRALIKRRDITQMSFGFTTEEDSWEGEDTKTPVRTLRKVNLFDVSPVTFPAYTQTSVKTRNLTDSSLDWDAILSAMTKRDHGLPVSQEEYRLIEETIEALKGYLPVPELQEEQTPVSLRGRNELSRFLALVNIK